MADTRISLACLPCRSRHLRCEGQKPTCSRCLRLSIDCGYAPSRRSGIYRKKQRATRDGPVTGTQRASLERTSDSSSGHFQQATEMQVLSDAWLQKGSRTEIGDFSPSSSVNNLSTHLDAYFTHFHASHPCAPPRKHLLMLMEVPCPGFQLVLSVMNFIGSLFMPEEGLVEVDDPLSDFESTASEESSPFEILALVLYCTAIYWQGHRDRARLLAANTARRAISIGMHLKEFASSNSGGDVVLAECWRRTWWQLYMTQLHIAAIHRDVMFASSQKVITSTSGLPCEDYDYEAGTIPTPRSLHEYDHREFSAPDARRFSSFAHLIGLARSLDRTVLVPYRDDLFQLNKVCVSMNSIVRGWLALLPPNKRSFKNPDGSIDENMFKAQAMIQVYLVEIHRPLSTLKHMPIETMSSCSPLPPPEHIPAPLLENAPMHTATILKAAERLIELLVLPSNDIVSHSPFSICMIASATIVLLVACKTQLRGSELLEVRERIRCAIGILEGLGTVWDRATVVVGEVRTIASNLLPYSEESETEMSSNGTPSVGNDVPSQSGDSAPSFGPDEAAFFDPGSFFGDLSGLDMLADCSGMFEGASRTQSLSSPT